MLLLHTNFNVRSGGEKMSRKDRKQQRKRKGNIEKGLDWITNVEIKSISDALTLKAIAYAKTLPLHDRFFCKKCNALYCLNNDGHIRYCKECKSNIKPQEETKGCTWAGCTKKVQDIRDCENH